MKLATYRDGSRDGQLVVVSRDLGLAHYATGIATRLQQALDDWTFLAPQLQDLSATLDHGKARHAFPFDPRLCMAPLPRAPQWVEGLSCMAHLEAWRATLGLPEVERARSEPLFLRGAGDEFGGPLDAFPVTRFGDAPQAGPGLAVITGDIPRGASAGESLDGVRLLAMVNAFRLAGPARADAQRGVESPGSRPFAAFAPVVVTPDEAGAAWADGRLAGSLALLRNGKPAGRTDTAAAMQLHFGQLLTALARHRALRAGSVVGSGPLAPSEPGGDLTGVDGLADGERAQVRFTLPDGGELFGPIDTSLVPAE
jgi:fumarylacetoacetate (FAA) hydrolase